ncbi:MaoC/PaaZ C-terminal domain-containing protein [Ferrovibrio xuzhouensis]|uniref:MaoC/PaaZ C-terminal domain-containing protein n=1 Tax=Ferrovibrio xuzhouensis TaxID=1576914 RepID=A0ABV7VFC1_9PROT
MPLNYEKLKEWSFPPVVQSVRKRDVQFYALSVGLGRDPSDERELRFVYERDLVVLPTMPAVIAQPGFWVNEPSLGIDLLSIFHGEQKVTLHRPLPTEGDIAGQSRISEVIDRGAGKGALIFVETKLSDRVTGALLCTIERSAFLRNDGGFGGPYRRHPPQHMIPERPADLQCDLPTTGQQALLYRLNGDDNPLHADPAIARRAGFELPVLHGLCTFGVAGHALLKSVCNYEPARVRSIGVRFTATAFPGDTIRTSIWRDEAGATFQCRAIERDTVIVDNGRLDFA